MRRELQAVARKGILAAELSRARERTLSQIADERDGIFNEIRSVSESTAAGGWTLGYTFEECIKKLKVADVNKAAKKYLMPANETSGILMDTLTHVQTTV